MNSLAQREYNFQTKNRWVADIPLSLIIAGAQDFKLNLYRFQLPKIETLSSKFAYLGYQVKIPGNSMKTDSMESTFEYLLSTDCSQYKNLYTWLSFYIGAISMNQQKQTDLVKASANEWLKQRLPVTITFLSEGKNPVMTVTYYDCWISELGELDLNYQTEPDPLKHSFTLTYSHFAYTFPTPAI